MESKRIQWIDVAKFFGIFAIYLGHFGPSAGFAYEFVYAFHVPLFFFLSGCVETANRRTFRENLRHKSLTLLLPYFLFGTMALLLSTIIANDSYHFPKYLVELCKGAIRDRYVAVGLWFLTCLFVMEIAFSVIKLIKNKWLILLTGLGISLLSMLEILPGPYPEPHMLYNADSALFYMVFYVIGYVVFPYVNEMFQSESRLKKYIVAGTGCCVGIYALLLFLGKDVLEKFWEINRMTGATKEIIRPLLLIWVVLVMAYWCRKVVLFNEIGKNTLYLCGSEYIILMLAVHALSLLGLKIQFTNPLCTYIYAFALLMGVHYILVSPEKVLLKKAQGILGKK